MSRVPRDYDTDLVRPTISNYSTVVLTKRGVVVWAQKG